jgi:hypothetical protein
MVVGSDAKLARVDGSALLVGASLRIGVRAGEA